MKICQKTETVNSENVSLFTLSSSLNSTSPLKLEIELISLGAGIRKIALQSPEGREHLLTLSYEKLSEYQTNGSLAGLTIGPNAGRIPATDGLIPNEGKNQIHGGLHNIARQNWKTAKLREETDYCEVLFETKQEDGLDGWPGNRNYRVRYHLDRKGIFTISYEAETDRPVYLNLTNHTYWLREGLSLSIAGNRICLNDDSFLPVETAKFPDSSGFPGINKKEGPLYEIPPSLVLNNGFFDDGSEEAVPPEKNRELHTAALLSYPELQIKLQTDAPALVVYTGDYLDDTALLCDGSSSLPRIAVALEAQEMATLQRTVKTLPGAPFHRTIRLSFSLPS